MAINKFETTPEPTTDDTATDADTEFPNAKKLAWDEDMPVSMLIEALQKLADDPAFGPDTPVISMLGDPREGGGIPTVITAVGPSINTKDGSYVIVVCTSPDVAAILGGQA